MTNTLWYGCILPIDFHKVLDSELPPWIESSMSVGNCMVFYIMGNKNNNYDLSCLFIFKTAVVKKYIYI